MVSIMSCSRDREDLDGYDLVEEIGRGRQSVIHKAVCTRGRLCSRLVAVKVTRLEVSAKDSVEASLTGAPKLQQELHHPNILAIYSTFAQLNTHIQVMEYCSLGSLVEYEGVKGHISSQVSFTARLVRGIANALVYLHDRRIVHRAIQPTNILLGENQTPKLSHFEDAVRLPSAHLPFIPPTAYTAPDLVRGQPESFPADIWSLGCVAIFALTAKPPTIQATAPMGLRALGCSPQVREMLIGMLDYNPSRRLSAEALASHRVPKPHLSVSPDRGASYLPVAPAQNSKSRRNSLGELRCNQDKQPFLDTRDSVTGEYKKIRLARRTVSDPLGSKKPGEYSFPLKNGVANWVQRHTSEPSSAGDRPGSAQPEHIANSTVPPLLGNNKEDAHQPMYINTSCLRPQSQKTREGRVSILPNGHVVVDFDGGLGVDEGEGKFMVIDSKQNRIYIYQDFNHSDVLLRSTPLARYTRESLPPAFWGKYQVASVVVEEMRKRAPKIVMYTDDGKYTSMVNGPPADVEVSFFPVVVGRGPKCQPDAKEETTLRIRYSKEQHLIELRRYTIGFGGQGRMTKRIMSIFNSKEIPQEEWARLDGLERDGLSRLLKFSEISKTIGNSSLTTHSFGHQLSAGTR